MSVGEIGVLIFCFASLLGTVSLAIALGVDELRRVRKVLEKVLEELRYRR